MKKKWLKVGVALLLVALLALQPLAGVVTLAEGEVSVTADWDEAKARQQMKIGSDWHMYRWFDNQYDQDNAFEDNSNRNGTFRPNYWVQLDLERSYYFSSFKLTAHTSADAVKALELYGSQDCLKWTKIYSLEDNTAQEIVGTIPASDTAYRYVKLQIVNRSQNTNDEHGWINIEEVELYGTPVTGEDPSSDPMTLVTDGWDKTDIVENIELGSTAKNSKRMYQWFDGVTDQHNMFQDDTKMAGKYRENYWVILDLKRAYTFDKFVITAGKDGSSNVKAFEFWGSNDKETWTQIASVTNNIDDVAEGKFTDQTNAYRYIKLQILDPNQNTDVSDGSINIAEVQIYGNTTEELPPEEPKPEMNPYSVLATEGWDLAKATERVEIGTHAYDNAMYKWFDNDLNIASFEDNTAQDSTNPYYRSNYWAIVDLETPRVLTGYSIIGKEDNNVRAFEFLGSNDKETWVSLAKEEKHVSGNAEGVFSDQEIAYRYVKLQILNRNQVDYDSGHGWIEISEVEIYALPSEEEMAMVAISGSLPEGSVYLTKDWTSEDYTKNVKFPDASVATGDGNGGNIVKWMDGSHNEDTWCQIKNPADWWIEIDLQKEETLTGFFMYSGDIGVDGYNDGPIRDIAFYGKNDTDDEWTKFAMYKGNTENELTAAFSESATYRYVRFEITKLRKHQDTVNPAHRWLGLYELELYGLASEPTVTVDPDAAELITVEKAENGVVTVTVNDGKTLAAGSLQAVDANTGKAVAEVKRVGFRENGDSNVYTFEMPAVSVVVKATEFTSENEPNMGLVGWSYNEDLGGLRSIHRVYVTKEGDKYYAMVSGEKKEVAEYGVIVGTNNQLGAGGAGTKRVNFMEVALRYDTCDAYEDLSVTVTGLSGIYATTPIWSCAYITIETDNGVETIYTEVQSKTYATATGLK